MYEIKKKTTNQPKLKKKNSTAYEVSDIKNVEWHTEYEKLHFYIFLTIITLCKRAIRRLLLDVQQKAGPENRRCGADEYRGAFCQM